MKAVKILGTGCPKCKQTTTIVEKAVEELELKDVTVEKVEDIMEILAYNVMSTPAVVINGEIKVRGRVPTMNELKAMLQ